MWRTLGITLTTYEITKYNLLFYRKCEKPAGGAFGGIWMPDRLSELMILLLNFPYYCIRVNL